jgi:cell shape-determining protein MreC
MTELEKHLLEALEQAQAQQQQREADLFKMFEITQQENLEIRAEFQSLLLNITETDQIRNENLNKLVRHVNSLSDQLQGFKTQNEALTKQLQALEMQVSKLKK